MIKALIVDDEPYCCETLCVLLERYCSNVSVIASCYNAMDALTVIKNQQPDLVFLDVEMPKMNGFEMLNAIPEKNFHIIFTTAYDQYAIKAIKFAAFDYLLKPVDIEELMQAVLKIKDKATHQTKQQIELLQQNSMRFAKNQLNKLAIPTLEGLLFYDIKDIVHLEATSNYTIIYFTDNTKITASKTLKEFDELLPENIFFRTHHSHIINLTFIKRYIRGNGGQIELKNGVVIEVSRRKKEAFLQAIGY